MFTLNMYSYENDYNIFANKLQCKIIKFVLGMKQQLFEKLKICEIWQTINSEFFIKNHNLGSLVAEGRPGNFSFVIRLEVWVADFNEISP